MILFSVPSCLTATFPQPTSLPTYSKLLHFYNILSIDHLKITLHGFIATLKGFEKIEITVVIVNGDKIKSFQV